MQYRGLSEIRRKESLDSPAYLEAGAYGASVHGEFRRIVRLCNALLFDTDGTLLLPAQA